MSMADRDGYIWYDGKLVPWRNATTHVLTHSLHYGLAVFEGVRRASAEHKGDAGLRQPPRAPCGFSGRRCRHR